MARGFKSTPRGFAAELNRHERRLLRQLFRDVIELLESGLPGSSEPVPGPDGGRIPPAAGPTSASSSTPSSDDDAFWQIVGDWEPSPGAVDDLDQGDASPRREPPRDPALARLLPAGMEAGAGAEEFRAATEDSLRAAKTEDLQRAVAALQKDHVLLSQDEAVGFSRALNDVRLVLATRLDIQDEQGAARVAQIEDFSQAEDVESTMALLYNFSSWLLETLMMALTSHLPD